MIDRILSLKEPFDEHVMTNRLLLLQIVNPFTKYALTMAPVAMSLEELIPSNHAKSHMYSILIRTALVLSTLLVALKIPFFGKLSCYNCTLSILPGHCVLDPLNAFGTNLPQQKKMISNLSTNCPAGFVMALIGSFFTMLVVSPFYQFYVFVT